MTTDIKGVHDFLDFLTNKAQGTYYSYAEKDAALHRAQMSVFMKYYGQSFLAEKVVDGLAPFKAYPNFPFLTSDTPNGVLSLPSNYQYLTGGHVIVDNGGHTEYNKIEIYDEDEISDRLRDQIKPVTTSKPIAMIAGRVAGVTKMQFFPKSPVAGEIFYLKEPTPPVFAYTQSGRTITYDAGASTQLDWNEGELNEVILAALEYLGVSADDNEITQYANAKSKEVI